MARPATFDRVDRVKRVAGQPVLPGDENFWILGDDLQARINAWTCVVPRGFTTDGASIPHLGQWLTGWKPWDEPQRLPAIVHDWLYCRQDTVKPYSDRVFRALLKSEGASWFRRNAMYGAVVVGGWPAYYSDQANGPLIFT